ncbi:hypothetical protein C0J52_00486 [Blattella germanica]|nr:hypothetical protein C0J52_00486 [Blattella germanica]
MMLLEAILIFSCILIQQQGANLQPLSKRNPVMNLAKSTLISDMLKSESDRCNITCGPDILSLCGRSVHEQTDLSYFDYEQAICMTLYDLVLRICNQTNTEKVHLKKNDEKVENISAFCNEMRSALTVSSSNPSKDLPRLKWVNLLKERLNKADDTTCKRTCIEGSVVNPVCSAVIQANAYLKKTEKSNVKLKKVDISVTPIITTGKQHGNIKELANPPQQNSGAGVSAISQQQGNVGSSTRQEDVLVDEDVKPSDVSYPENPLGVPTDTTDDRLLETQQGSNDYQDGISGMPFITDEEFQLKQQTGKIQEIPENPSSPSEPTKDGVLKTPNSDKNEKIKTHDGKTNSNIEKVQVEEKTPSEIPDKKPLVLHKEKPKSSEHKPSEGKQTQPSQTIKSEVDNKEADPQVNSQGVPPKINPKVSLPNPDNIESGKTDNADGSAKETVDVKEENTAAETPPVLSSDPNMMSPSNNANDANDNGSLEDDRILPNDPDLKYPQNENSLKKESLNDDDDDVEISPNEPVIPGQKFVNAEDSHFFAYFMTMVILCIIGYLVFHNKQKILALALEGRSRRSTRRRPNTSGYRKLDSNLEEAVTSACSTSVTHVIY